MNKKEGLVKAIEIISNYREPIGAQLFHLRGRYCSVAILAKQFEGGLEYPQMTVREHYGFDDMLISAIIMLNDDAPEARRKSAVLKFLQKQLEACDAVD